MPIDHHGLEAAAARLLDYRLGGTPIDGAWLGDLVADGLAVDALQAALARRAAATELGPVVGHKIGMSTDAAQHQHGLLEPLAGHIYGTRLLDPDAELVVKKGQRIGVECEVVVRLGRDLAGGTAPLAMHTIQAAVGSLHVGIELIEDRFSDITQASIWAMAADDMLAMGGVVGPKLDGFDAMADHEGSILLDGAPVVQGASRDLQGGGPIATLAWLARRRAAAGRPLRAGELVFTGGITQAYWLEPKPGDATLVEAVISDVGKIACRIAWSSL